MKTAVITPVVSRSHSWFIFLGLVLVWGSSFILIKKGLQYYSPEQVGALRIASAGFALAIPAMFFIQKMPLKKILFLLISGLLGNLIPSFLFALAQTEISSSVSGILNALTPLFTFVVGILFFNQKLSSQKFIGLGVGLVGLCIFILGKDGNAFSINKYALLIVLATICYGFNVNIAKQFLSDLRPIEVASVALMLTGGLASLYLFGFTNFVEITSKMPKNVLWEGLGGIIFLGIVGSAVSSIFFYRLVQISSPVFASSVTYFIPIVAVLWGIFLLNEQLLLWHYIGMAAIILGVLIVNRSK